jgi:hypothetical protein
VNCANNVEIYKKQAEIHRFELPLGLLQRNDLSEITEWMSCTIDEMARDKTKFPDWLTGCIHEVI